MVASVSPHRHAEFQFTGIGREKGDRLPEYQQQVGSRIVDKSLTDQFKRAELLFTPAFDQSIHQLCLTLEVPVETAASDSEVLRNGQHLDFAEPPLDRSRERGIKPFVSREVITGSLGYS